LRRLFRVPSNTLLFYVFNDSQITINVIMHDAMTNMSTQQMLLMIEMADGSLLIEIKFLKSFKSLKSSFYVFWKYRDD
jgi:hypothetical protein